MLLAILISLCFAIINFVIKNRIAKKFNIYSVDEYTHLTIIETIQKNKRIPEVFSRFLVDKKYKIPFSYPHLFHYLFSFLPVELIHTHMKDIVALLDSLNIVLLGGFSFFITQSFFSSLMIILIYLGLSCMIIEGFRFTPRILSYLITNLIICLLSCVSLIDFPTNIFLIILIAVLITSILFMSKFSVQVLLVILVSLLLLPNYRSYVFYIFLTTLTFLTFFGRYYKKILIEHIGCIKKSYWYCKTLNFNLKKIAVLVMSIPFLVLFMFYLKNSAFFLEKVNLMFLTTTFSLFLFGLLTVFLPFLRCVGEGERYLQHTIFPLSFLLGNFLSRNFSPINFLFVLISILPIFLGSFVVFKKEILNKKTLPKNIFSFCQKIKKLEKNNILVLTKSQPINTVVMYLSGKNIFDCLSIPFFWSHRDMFYQLEKNLTKIIKKFDINYILVDKEKLEENKELKKYKKILRDKKYYLLKT